MPEPKYTGIVCPKCREPKAAITSPTDAASLAFRCGVCDHEWAGLAEPLRVNVTIETVH